MPPSARRPLKTRNRSGATAVARMLGDRGATPDGISLAGVLLAAAGGACLALSGSSAGAGQVVLLVGAAVFIQLRLAANMLDGLVAVEGGKGGRLGPLFNEVPDRFEDLALLVPAGYAVSVVGFGPELGWAAGALAVLTAYLRVLGGSLGQEQRFSGPMAKPHRMFVLTLGCVAGAVEAAVSSSDFEGVALLIALGVVILGSALTCVLRLRRIATEMPA